MQNVFLLVCRHYCPLWHNWLYFVCLTYLKCILGGWPFNNSWFCFWGIEYTRIVRYSDWDCEVFSVSACEGLDLPWMSAAEYMYIPLLWNGSQYKQNHLYKCLFSKTLFTANYQSVVCILCKNIYIREGHTNLLSESQKKSCGFAFFQTVKIWTMLTLGI